MADILPPLKANKNHQLFDATEYERKDGLVIEYDSPSNSGSDFSDSEERRIKVRKPKTKAPKSEHEQLTTERRARLPSAEEIYNRIKWDMSAVSNIDDYSVGYEDRFIGIMEVRFNEFELGVIPLHRVRIFKYQDNIIWNRNTKEMNFPAFDEDQEQQDQ
eukprot:gene1186-1364_t